MMLINIQSL